MKALKGKVVSLKMNKTATVAVERMIAHSMYLKRYKRTKKYQVHTDQKVKIGDIVSFIACRPISKTKKHKIIFAGEKVSKEKKVPKTSKKGKKK